MKTVALSVLLAVGAAWAVVELNRPAARGYDATAMDLEDRLSMLEARVAELDGSDEPVLLASGTNPDDLRKRLTALEEKVAHEPRRTAPAPAGAGLTAPTEVAGTGRAPGKPEAKAGEAWKKKMARLMKLVEKTRRLDVEARGKGLHNLALMARQNNDHQLEEKLFREAVETLGPDHETSRESAYQIGWARSARRDYAGAREAWLESARSLPEDHWRRAYARYYAAESAVKAGDHDVAEGELEVLVEELETGGDTDRYGTVLGRSRSLLERLRG